MKFLRVIHSSLVLGALTMAAAAAAAASLERYEFVQPQMGTLFKITLFSTDAARAQAAAKQAFDKIAELDQTLSDYRADSELMRLSQQTPGVPVPVSAALFETLQLSQTIATATAGAFDVTMGSLTHLWRTARSTGQLPPAQTRTLAMRPVGSAGLALDATRQTVTLQVPGMQLDTGGIAKGHAADRALAELARAGFRHAMVAASGDLALGDAPPGLQGWRIDIAPFGGDAGKPLQLVAANAGISTSADTEQFLQVDGVRYSHIVDPRTGLGVTRPIGVTTVAPNAAWSDGLSTAFSILDAGAVKASLAALNVPVRVIRQYRNSPELESFGTNPPGLISGLP